MVSLIAGTIMFFAYMQVPTVFFGVDRYSVTVQLPQAGGLYPGGNVTYRGVEIGRVQAVRLTETGAEAELQMDSDVHVPANLDAQVHSVSAVGEQYVELLPRYRERAVAERRRRDPRGPHVRPTGHQLPAGRRPTAVCPRSHVTT